MCVVSGLTLFVLSLQVMDMEYELRALRAQLLEKCKHSSLLQKEVLPPPQKEKKRRRVKENLWDECMTLL